MSAGPDAERFSRPYGEGGFQSDGFSSETGGGASSSSMDRAYKNDVVNKTGASATTTGRREEGSPFLTAVFVGALSVGAAAIIARSGLRGAKKVGLEMPQIDTSGLSKQWSDMMSRYKKLDGFERSMNRAEAIKILNLSNMQSYDKEKVKEMHRKLVIRNHPDKGGSTYIATKINEAKDTLLGKRSEKR